MEATVGREFRVEGGDDHPLLPESDRLTRAFGEDLNRRSRVAEARCSDKHALGTVIGTVIGTVMGARRGKNTAIWLSDRPLGQRGDPIVDRADKAVDLIAVGVAINSDLNNAPAGGWFTLSFTSEQDRSRAGAKECEITRRRARTDRFPQLGVTEQAPERGALSSRHDQAIDLVEGRRLPDRNRGDPERLERREVRRH